VLPSSPGGRVQMVDIEAQTNGPKKIKIDLDPLEWLIIAITIIVVSYLIY